MTDLFSLRGRHALVTGASGGLGAFFARELASHGATVTLAARRADALESVAASIRADGGEAFAVSLDVTDETSIRGAFDDAQRNAGVAKILVNNAGIATTRKALDVEPAEFDAVLDTNLRGSWLVAREAASRLVDAGEGGSIVNIASILALRVAGAVMPYAVSKAGVVQMTKALALEWARHGIRVNALAPGYFETELNAAFIASEPGQAMLKRIPNRRLGRLEELVGPLLLLASDAGAYMTGSVVTVDGGHTVSSL